MITVSTGMEVSARYAKIIKGKKREMILVKLFGRVDARKYHQEVLSIYSTNKDITPLLSATVLRVKEIKQVDTYERKWNGKVYHQIIARVEMETASTIDFDETEEDAAQKAEMAYLNIGGITADDLLEG